MVYALVLGTSTARFEGSSPSSSTLDFFYISAILIYMSKIHNKKITYKIILSLEILAILCFGLFFTTTQIKAYDDSAYLRIYNYQRQPALPPSISSIEPDSINGITNKITITINGSGFTPNSVVRKNNSNRTTTFIDANHLLVDIYANDMQNQKEFFLTVFNSEIERGYSNASTFSIKNNNTIINSTNNTANNYSSTSNNVNNNYNNENINNTNTETTTDNTVSNIDNNKDNFGSLTANALVGSSGFMPTGLVQWILLFIMIIAIIVLWRYIHRSEEEYMSTPLKHA